MFDIGLFELLVVGGVGLVVIGPEKLPGALRTGALWIGRIKRSIVETRREIEQHIGADDIRRELRNEEIMASLEKLREARTQLEQDIKAHTSGAALEHQDIDNNGVENDQNQPVHGEHNDRDHQALHQAQDTHSDNLEPSDAKAVDNSSDADHGGASNGDSTAKSSFSENPNSTKEAGSAPTKS